MTATATLAAAPATLRLYGEIGQEVLAEDVASSLAAAGGRPITVAIFSWGGDAATGLAIHGLLARYSGRVTVVIDGVAASAASLIAMAGDHVVMPEDSLLMAHDPWKIAKGNASSMRSSADLLDAHAASYRQAYARKSGASLEQVAAWMAADQGSGTWFTAQQALAAGLADEVVAPALVRAQAPQMPSGRFSNAPAALAVWATDQVNAQSTQPNTEPMTLDNSNIEVNAEADQGLSRAEANRHLQVERSAALAQLTREQTDNILATTNNTADGVMAVLKIHASAVETRAGASGHPARFPVGGGEPQGVAAEISAALQGKALQQPLWLSLREAGVGRGSDPQSVWASALAGEGRWLARGSLSTSDLPQLLQGAGNRELLNRFQVADAGIRVAANVRALVDYREASVLDVGMVGTAKEIKEGGEILFTSVNENGISYKPSKYAVGLRFTAQSMANDDLSGLQSAIAEMADAALDVEASALVDLLEGAANGRNTIDGLALFAAGHGNSVAAGPVGIGTIGTAVSKMRKMQSAGGRFLSQSPAFLICGPDMETTIRQLLSPAINATEAANYNPWSSLQVAVEPRLSGGYVYIVGDTRKPLQLGRLTAGPVLTTEADFATSDWKSKSEHSFGVAAIEWRSIIRIPTAS